MPPRKALIAVTSAHAPLYLDGKETGMLITEALNPFNIFLDAGFEQEDWLPKEDRITWMNPKSDFRQRLDAHLAPGDVSPEIYGVFFASAGHASLIDYPNAKGLQSIASTVYTNGGIVPAVCHGGAIFPGIMNAKTGKSVISGKRVIGFTTKGEEEEGVLRTIKSCKKPTIEAAAADAGAHYVSPPGPWDSFTQTNGTIVTGANPASAKATAEAVIEAFDKL